MFNQKGKNIDNQGTNLLSDMAGDSLWHLDNEIQKYAYLLVIGIILQRTI